MIGHERLDSGLDERTGDAGIRSVAAALEHLQHRLGDDG